MPRQYLFSFIMAGSLLITGCAQNVPSDISIKKITDRDTTVITDIQKNILEGEKLKGNVEADYVKDSWINPLHIEGSISKIKNTALIKEMESKNISINFDQALYRNGAITDTIAKGKHLKALNIVAYRHKKKLLLSSIYTYAIHLKKLDLLYKKNIYLINNKKMEIKKRQEQYANGLVDVVDLDESVIELHGLRNQNQDIQIEKIKLIKEFKKLSKYKYKDIDFGFLSKPTLRNYLLNNTFIKEKKLSAKIIQLDEQITYASFLPKISTFGSYGYKNEDFIKKGTDYVVGLKVSMPFDYNANRQKERVKLEHYLANQAVTEGKKNEESSFVSKSKQLKYIDNKIQNTKKIVTRYDNIYKSVHNMYKNNLKSKEDSIIIKNSLNSNKIDIKMLKLDKKLILVELFAKS